MNTRYMLMHKLHFVKVNLNNLVSFNCVNLFESPIIYLGQNFINKLNTNLDVQNLDWYYWSKNNLHRYAKIKVEALTANIAKKYNLDLSIDYSNMILGANFYLENQISTKEEIAVIATFSNLNPQEILFNTANIYLYQQDNLTYQHKCGVNIRKYIDLCQFYKINKHLNKQQYIIHKINDCIEELNSLNYTNMPINFEFSNEFYINWLEENSIQHKQKTMSGILNECIIEYEGSTAIDFAMLYDSGILPQQMVYFYLNDQEICHQHQQLSTYTLVAPLGSKLWSANGGIANHLTPYLGQIGLSIKT